MEDICFYRNHPISGKIFHFKGFMYCEECMEILKEKTRLAEIQIQIRQWKEEEE